MKALKFHLEDFGREALDEFVRRRRDSHSSAVRTASLYYLADRDRARPAWLVPQSPMASAAGAPHLTVRLDAATWQALHDEAERQAVSPAELTRHAVLYFLADVDSGRVGERLERALSDHDAH
jgi:predicted DNA-binding ribbon-helix-helix protein